MPAVARLGDSISHGGQIITGSGNVFCDNKPVARVGDLAACVEHGIVQIVSGSSQTFVNNKALARVGDSLSCGAVISSGSGTWFDQ